MDCVFTICRCFPNVIKQLLLSFKLGCKHTVKVEPSHLSSFTGVFPWTDSLCVYTVKQLLLSFKNSWIKNITITILHIIIYLVIILKGKARWYPYSWIPATCLGIIVWFWTLRPGQAENLVGVGIQVLFQHLPSNTWIFIRLWII